VIKYLELLINLVSVVVLVVLLLGVLMWVYPVH
jgi:hypothetical protein